MNTLFIDADNKCNSADDIRGKLLEIGAADCKTLFIHSDVMFGRPPLGFRKADYLGNLYEVLASLDVENLIFPTFTYSFCNGETYDIAKSKSYMGALSEYVRNLPGQYRTDDPLLSVTVPENIHQQFENLSTHSLGLGSAMDVLHHMDSVKFLFFGAEMANCFTYVHYVEKILDVPYRFDMMFEGNIIHLDGHIEHRTQVIHTQCHGVKMPKKYDYFEMKMEEMGLLKKRHIGDKYIACISERDAYREIRSCIENDISFFLEEPFKESELIRQYTYDVEDGRITHC